MTEQNKALRWCPTEVEKLYKELRNISPESKRADEIRLILKEKQKELENRIRITD